MKLLVDLENLVDVSKPIRYKRGPKFGQYQEKAPQRVHTSLRLPKDIYDALADHAMFLKENLSDTMERSFKVYLALLHVSQSFYDLVKAQALAQTYQQTYPQATEKNIHSENDLESDTTTE